MGRNSLDGAWTFAKDVDDTRSQLMAGISTPEQDVVRLSDAMQRMKTSATSGGFSSTEYEDVLKLVATVERKVEEGTIECDTEQVETALNKVRMLAETYKSYNSFAGKSDEATDTDIDTTLVLNY